jgi:hypothetical protein
MSRGGVLRLARRHVHAFRYPDHLDTLTDATAYGRIGGDQPERQWLNG